MVVSTEVTNINENLPLSSGVSKRTKEYVRSIDCSTGRQNEIRQGTSGRGI